MACPIFVGGSFLFLVNHWKGMCMVDWRIHAYAKLHLSSSLPSLVRSLVGMLSLSASVDNSGSSNPDIETTISKQLDGPERSWRHSMGRCDSGYCRLEVLIVSLTCESALVVVRYELHSTVCYLSILCTLYGNTEYTSRLMLNDLYTINTLLNATTPTHTSRSSTSTYPLSNHKSSESP